MKPKYLINAFYTFLILAVFVVIISIAILTCRSKSNAKFKIVGTNNGKVQGDLKTTFMKKIDYYSFKGIPYGKPPTGELRFKVRFRIEELIVNSVAERAPIAGAHFYIFNEVSYFTRKWN